MQWLTGYAVIMYQDSDINELADLDVRDVCLWKLSFLDEYSVRIISEYSVVVWKPDIAVVYKFFLVWLLP